MATSRRACLKAVSMKAHLLALPKAIFANVSLIGDDLPIYDDLLQRLKAERLPDQAHNGLPKPLD
jgi:hypothetical protein